MSTATENQQPAGSSSLKGVLVRHPAAAFLVIAYGFAWTSLLPALLSEQGFGLLAIGVSVQAFVLLSSVVGLVVPALLVAAARKACATCWTGSCAGT